MPQEGECMGNPGWPLGAAAAGLRSRPPGPPASSSLTTCPAALLPAGASRSPLPALVPGSTQSTAISPELPAGAELC